MKTPLEKLIEQTLAERSPTLNDLALGWLRYETLRRFNSAKYAEIQKRNLNGENFDRMIDDELLKWKETK